MALVRIHAGHAALCDLGAAVVRKNYVSFAKVAFRFAQHFIDAGAAHDVEKAPQAVAAIPAASSVASSILWVEAALLVTYEGEDRLSTH